MPIIGHRRQPEITSLIPAFFAAGNPAAMVSRKIIKTARCAFGGSPIAGMARRDGFRTPK